MVNSTHDKQVKRWAEYVRANPNEWKKHFKPFIDAQIIMATRFYNNLAKSEEGRIILKRLRESKIRDKPIVI